MPVEPALAGVEQLKDQPAVARLLAWNPGSLQDAKLDRDELTLVLQRAAIRDAVALLRVDATLQFNFLADVTCVDWYPREPRFEVVYHLLSIPRKARLRL